MAPHATGGRAAVVGAALIAFAAGRAPIARAGDPKPAPKPAPAAGAPAGPADDDNELPPDLAPKRATDAPPAAPAPSPSPAPAAGAEHPVPPPPPPGDPNDPKTKAEARKLIDGGDTFLKKGDYLEKHGKHAQAVEQFERALAAYQKAYDLVANAQIYYAIAGAEEKLGKWLDAAHHYQKMLAEATDMKPELKEAATARLDAVKAYLGQVSLTITPDGAHVTVDGKDAGQTPLKDPLLLEPGEYTLGFAADGYTPMEQKLKVEAGSESERTFALQRLPIVVEKPREPPPPPPGPPPGPNKLPLYVGAGATGVFAVTSLITGIVAVKKHGTFTDPAAAADVRAAARTSGKHYALACDLTMVGALAAGGFTVYWYLERYRKEAAGEAAPPPGDGDDGAAAMPRVWVEPVWSPEAAGVAVGGSF